MTISDSATKKTNAASLQVSVVYPSPILVAGPLLMAIALVAGGVARGMLMSRHSTPAIFLLLLSYLFSRWFRRSAVVFTNDSVMLGETTMRLEDIAKITPEKTAGRARNRIVLNFYDRNGVQRLSLQPNAYGTGLNRIRDELRARLPADAVQGLSSISDGRRVLFLWIATGMLCVLALIEGFTAHT